MLKKQFLIGAATGLLIVSPTFAQQPPPVTDDDSAWEEPTQSEPGPTDPAPAGPDTGQPETGPMDPQPANPQPADPQPSGPAPTTQDPAPTLDEEPGDSNALPSPMGVDPVPDGTAEDAMEMLRSEGFNPESVKSDDQNLGLYTIRATSPDGELVLVQIDVNEGQYWVHPIQ